MKPMRLHHVGIVLPTLQKAHDFIEANGLEIDYAGFVDAYHADLIFTKKGPFSSPLEMIIPREGVLTKFNNGKGGIAHIAFEVDDVEAVRQEMEAECPGCMLEKKAVLTSLLQAVINESKGLPIVAPLHPYVEKVVKSLELNAPNLYTLPPQSYLHFGFLINQAKGIVTDSGNIAEEATFLDVPCITLNTYAEHPETWRIGTNELVGENSFALTDALRRLMSGDWKHATLPDRWDGRTAERIVRTLLK